MLADLEGNRLEVCKIPSKQGGYIRVCISTNAEWYQRFCGAYMGTRSRYAKPRTIIRRVTTTIALKRMLAGDRGSVYAKRLLEAAGRLYEAYGDQANQGRDRNRHGRKVRR